MSTGEWNDRRERVIWRYIEHGRLNEALFFASLFPARG